MQLGWKLDYLRFRRYLAERHNVSCALLFMGFVSGNRGMYRDFKSWGYVPMFVPSRRGQDNQIKGNCDTELAVQAISGCYEGRYDKAVLVTGDGDFVSVTNFLAARGKLQAVVAPSFSRCSSLLRQPRFNPTPLDGLRGLLEYVPSSTN
jgi:uncharacterized LabA/DUF88 family protein